MGLPTSYKRARLSPSPDRFDSPEAQGREFRDWAPVASSKPAVLARATYPCPPSSAVDSTWTTHTHSHSHAQQPQAQRESPMEQLSDPLLLKVLQMSQPTAWDLCRLSCVSAAFRRASSHRSFWTRLRVGSGSLRPGVEQLAPRCTELAELFIDDPRCELHILHPIIIACAGTLKRVVVDCDRDSSSRNEASISSILWLISLYCKGVESIELQSNGQEASASIGSLENRTMWYLTSAFRNIRYFSCLPRASLTKQCIYLMAIAWRDLECVRINMEGLQLADLLALRKCSNLRALEVVGGSLNPLNATPPAADVAAGAAPAHEGQSHPCENQPDVDHCGYTSSTTQGGAVEGARGQALFGGAGCSPVLDVLRQLGEGSIFHPSLELLVLNRVECDSATAASLAMCCPNLKRILVSGELCDSCATHEGPCASGALHCVRRKVDMIQLALSRVRVSLQQ